VVGFLVFIGTYFVCGGDKGLATKVIGAGTTIGTLLIFGLLPFVKPISKWIGKKGALLAATVIGLIVALIQPFALRPGHPWLLLVPQLIFTLLNPFALRLSMRSCPIYAIWMNSSPVSGAKGFSRQSWGF